ncbi:MAG TPA: molybdenum cofactor guanylyltransferase [Magnetospirillaceae bacterium]|nr:molybdenum cofactor guanylyltransferase [Magnetospirillaceae bacterium]
MSASARTTTVLLAGGPATRLPGKLALDVEGEPMLVRSYRRLTASGWPCVISARTPLAPALARALRDPEVALDEIADGGPLAGLCSAARAVRTPLFFAAAADLPNLTADFARALVAAYDAAPAPKPNAVLPTWDDGHVEPLAALYEREAFVGGAEAALAAGKRKVTAALDGLRVLGYRVEAHDACTLLNVNTPADFETLRRTSAAS